MGVFKILGGIALGVGAVAAAPFTGGGSILGAASLATSLAGAGIATATAATVGGIAGAVKGKTDDEKDDAKQKAAHEIGYEAGIIKGNIETKKTLVELLEKNGNLRIATFALGMYVANIDDDFATAEKDEIERYMGRPDSVVNKEFRAEFKKIYDNLPNFNEIKLKYLDGCEKDEIKGLNNFIYKIIEADGRVSKEEKQFLDGEWKIYLESRKID